MSPQTAATIAARISRQLHDTGQPISYHHAVAILNDASDHDWSAHAPLGPNAAARRAVYTGIATPVALSLRLIVHSSDHYLERTSAAHGSEAEIPRLQQQALVNAVSALR